MTLYLEAEDPDGTECETCGWTKDECQIDCEGNGTWVLQGRWGCYSGDHYQGTREQMIDYLSGPFRTEWGHLFTPLSIREAIIDLENA